MENKDKIKQPLEGYEILTGEAEAKRLAEIRRMSELEEKAALAAAEEKGFEEEFQKGLGIGMEKVRIYNIPIDVDTIAKKMIKMGFQIEIIAEVTELSKDEIDKLA